MTKSEAAFRLSAAKLFEESRDVFFWTITFREVHCDWQYSTMWNRFWLEFTDKTNYFLSGIRVTEFHSSHGIHFHLLCNRRLPVQVVRRFGRRWGIGRVHVAKVRNRAELGDDVERMVGYMAKYLTKDGRSQFHTAMRKWSCFGGFEGVKVRNIEVDCEFNRMFDEARKGRQVGYRGFLHASREYVRTGVVGRIPFDFVSPKRKKTIVQRVAEAARAAKEPLGGKVVVCQPVKRLADCQPVVPQMRLGERVTGKASLMPSGHRKYILA